jgi:hypothetical protein
MSRAQERSTAIRAERVPTFSNPWGLLAITSTSGTGPKTFTCTWYSASRLKGARGRACTGAAGAPHSSCCSGSMCSVYIYKNPSVSALFLDVLYSQRTDRSLTEAGGYQALSVETRRCEPACGRCGCLSLHSLGSQCHLANMTAQRGGIKRGLGGRSARKAIYVTRTVQRALLVRIVQSVCIYVASRAAQDTSATMTELCVQNVPRERTNQQ